MKILKVIVVGVIVLVLIGVLLGAFAIDQVVRTPLPQVSGELTFKGLNSEVEILRDAWGVPHIYADNSHDLFFAQGVTHAQDRWWQMEWFRHVGAGRISELTGLSSSVIGNDLFIRTIGWYEAAERDWEETKEPIRSYIQSFSDGINAYIHSRTPQTLASEYTVLGITGVKFNIEDWTPVDTLVWTKVMAYDLSGNYDIELLLSELNEALGPEMVSSYTPPYPYDEKATIIFPEDLPIGEGTLSNPESDSAGINGITTELAGNFAGENFAFGKGDGIGSNNWVIGGDKTESGMPLLANDPHLSIQMPSIWYEIGLHCREVNEECPFNLTGFTFAPAPGIVIGHNDRIAWGVTNVGWDTQDLYTLKINPDNDLQYEWNGEWRDMTVRDEVINFGDTDKSVTIKVRETHLGPIINDNQYDSEEVDWTVNNGIDQLSSEDFFTFNNENPMALHWTATAEVGSIVESILRINQAQNWEDFREALSYWDSPSQNVIYADVDGNIGYQTPGRVPVRAKGHTGQLPVDGTTDEFEWLGYVPYDLLPRVLNPERGYIATANQALVPLAYYDQLAEALSGEFGDANYIFDYFWAYGYRGQRIVDLIESSDAHNFESIQKIHGDNEMTSAKELMPYIQAVDFENDELNSLRDWLGEWDYQMHMNSPQAALYAAFWRAMMENLYQDQLGDITDASGGGQEMWATYLLMEDPENEWWDNIDTDAVESRDDIIKVAFKAGSDEVNEFFGTSDRNQWKWGSMHGATFVSNPLGLSGIDLIESNYNRGPVRTSGGSAIVNATGWNAAVGYEVRAVPSMRMIVDLGNLEDSKFIHTTGQSGHTQSAHYGDMIDPWRMIEYQDMLWTVDQVASQSTEKLVLKPGS